MFRNFLSNSQINTFGFSTIFVISFNKLSLVFIKIFLLFDNFCNSMIRVASQFVNLEECIGYEFWTQKNTRPSKWHYDKDEQLKGNENVVSFPLCSMIYYLIVENLDGGQLQVEDDIITPKTNRLVIFSPGKYHYVQPYTGTRISMLVNPWNRVLNKSN